MRTLVWVAAIAAVVVACEKPASSPPPPASKIAAARPRIPIHPVDQRGLPFVGGRALVKFKPGTSPQRVAEVLERVGAVSERVLPKLDVQVLKLAPGREEATVDELAAAPEVAYAVLDHVMNFAATPNDPSYGSQWHLGNMNAPAAWDVTTGSSSTVIAVLDSGVDGSHPDLAGQLVAGWNFRDNSADTTDTIGHGTLVAGAAAAATNNAVGGAGVCWSCKVMPLVVSDTSGRPVASNVAQGLIWAADHGARLATLSMLSGSGSVHDPVVADAAKYFVDGGGLVFAAAGNAFSAHSVADDPNILNVSGAYRSGTSFMSYGDDVDLTAPGDQILTTQLGGGYANASGASMAAPLAAGVAALAMAANPSLSAARVADIVRLSARDFVASGQPSGWDPSTGWGFVDAAAAVNMARNAGVGGDTVSPKVMNPVLLDSQIVHIVGGSSATVSGYGIDDVGVTGVTLLVDGLSVGSASGSPFTVSFDSVRFSDGRHTATLNDRDAAGNVGGFNFYLDVDNTAPRVTVSSPSAGATLAGNVVVGVSVTEAHPARVDISLGGLRCTMTGSGNCVLDTLATDGSGNRLAPDGSATVTVVAADTAGNVSAPVSVPVTIDNSATIRVRSPAQSAWVGGVVNVDLDAVSTRAAITRVDLLVNSSVVTSLSAPPWVAPWNTSGVTGSARLSARLVLADGRTLSSDQFNGSVSVNVDNIAPSLDPMRPLDGSFGRGFTTVSSSASDASLDHVDVLVDGNVLQRLTPSGQPLWINVSWNTFTVSDGAHDVGVLAVDKAGNQTSQHAAVIVDNTNPTLALLSPTDGSVWTDTLHIEISSADAYPDRVELSINRSLVAVLTQAPYVFDFDLHRLPNDVATLDVVVVDKAGNAVRTAASFTVDHPGPMVNIASPHEGDTVSGNVIVNADIRAGHTPLSMVTWAVDGVQGGTASGPSYGFGYDTTRLSSGVHALSMTATDTAGLSATHTIHVTVDNDAPVVIIKSPPSGSVLYSSTYVTFDATDLSPITNVYLLVDGVQVFSGTSLPASAYANLSSEGAHQVTAVAMDRFNHYGQTSITLYADRTPPAVSFTAPTSNQVVTGVVTAQVAASDTWLTAVDFIVDGTVVATSNRGGSFTWDTSGAAFGTHYLQARATDAARNTTTAGVQVFVDKAAPTLQVSGASPVSCVGSSVTVTYSAQDDYAINERYVEVDGVRVPTQVNSTQLVANVSGISSGTHSLTAVVTDFAGHLTRSAPISISIDHDPPQLQVTSPSAGVLVAGSVTVRASITDACAVPTSRLLLNGVDQTSLPSGTPPGYAVTFSSVGRDGTLQLAMRATDSAGNTGTSPSVSVIVDNVAPIVSVTSPAVSSRLRGTVTLSANASDNRSLARVDFFVDGAAVGTATGTPWQLAWTSSTVSNAAHTFTAKAFDTVGNTATSAAVSAVVDNAAPTVTLTQPAAGLCVADTAFTVSATASDNDAVSSVALLVDGAVAQSRSSAPWSFTIDPQGLSAGPHAFAVEATDAAGNVTRSSAIQIRADKTAPDVAFSSPTDGSVSMGPVTVEAQASDDVELSVVQLEVDGTKVDERAAPPWTLQWNGSSATEGDHVLTLRAADCAGRGAAVQRHVTIDRRAPSVAVTSPADGAVVNGTVPVQITASDASLSQVDLLVDDVLVASAASSTTFQWDSTTVAAGPHTLKARATDAVGLSSTAQRTVIVDRAPPSVSLTGLLGGACAGPSVAVSFSASDDTGIADAFLELDGVRMTVQSGSGTLVGDTSAVPSGGHDVVVVVTDLVGNVTRSAPASVLVDHEGPEVVLTSPSAGLMLPGAFTARATIQDACGVQGGRVLVNGIDDPNLDWATAPDFSVTLTTSTEDGTLQVAMRGVDSLGNASISAPVAVTVDGVKPQVALSAPATGARLRGTVLVRAAASDNQALGHVVLEADGQPLADLTSPPFEATWDTTSTTPGTHQLTARAFDQLGNTASSAPVAVVVDNAPPAVAVTLPSANACVGDVLGVQVAASDDDALASVTLLFDGEPAQTLTAAPWTFTVDARSVAGGTHAVAATAADLAGNVSTSPAVSLNLDKVAPVALWTAPAELATFHGSVPVSAAVSDDVAAVSLTLLADGTAVAQTSSAPWALSWDASAATSGEHLLTLRVTDCAGRTSSSDRRVVIDNTPPDVAVSSPVANQRVGASLTLSASASDASGLSQVAFFIDGNLVATLANPPYTTVWDASAASTGNHVATAQATDALGNASTSAAIGFFVDHVAPAVSLSAPSNAACVGDSALSLVATASDNDALSSVALSVDGTPVATKTAAPWSFTLDPATLGGGAHVLEAVASDLAGNVTRSAGQSITLDKAAPGVAYLTPAAQESFRGVLTVDASVSDDVKAVSLALLVDGVSKATVQGAPWRLTWDSASGAEGDHRLTLVATDCAGRTTSVDRHVIVDRTAPQVTLTSPAKGSKVSGVITLSATASDANVVDQVAFSVDGKVVGVVKTPPWSMSYDTKALSTGLHTFTATATDHATNSASSSITATVKL